MASIAKLSIQITTDTTRMVAGFKQAQVEVKGLEGLLAKSGGIGLGIAAIAKGAQVLEQGFKFARDEASKLQDRMAEVGMLSKGDTLTSAWKEFGEVIGTLALPSLQAMTKELKAFTSDLASLTGADGFLNQLKAAEAQQKAIADAAKKEEDRRDGIRKAVADQVREMDKLNDRARQLIESVRTPGEILDAGTRELGRLLSENLIGLEQAERVAAKLAKDFQDASGAAKKIEQSRISNPALQQGSLAEFSERNRRSAEQREQAEAAKRAANEAAESRKLLQRILDQLENAPRPVVMGRGVIR